MWTRFSVLLSRVRALFTGRRLDRDFNDELQTHLAMLTEENVRRGLSPAEAARQASLRLGGVSQLAITRPSVDAVAVTKAPQAISTTTTGQVQCLSSDSAVSSNVA